MMRWHVPALAMLVLVTAGCSLPGRVSSSDEPTALSPELMQAGPQVVYQAPAREQVVGCVVVGYVIGRDAPAREQVVGCVVVGYVIGRDGLPQDVTIQASHPAGYFDAEVLNLMKVLSFKPRNQPEPRTRTFTFVPPDSGFTREVAASLCSSSLTLPPPK